jgi:hypothetical protein
LMTRPYAVMKFVDQIKSLISNVGIID